MKTYSRIQFVSVLALLIFVLCVPLSHIEAAQSEQIALSAQQINKLINDNLGALDFDVQVTNGRVSLSDSGLITYRADSLLSSSFGGVNVKNVLVTGTIAVSNCSIQFQQRSIWPVPLTILPIERTLNEELAQYVTDENICVDSVKVTPVQVIYVYHPVIYGDTTINNGRGATPTTTPDKIPASSGGIVPQCGKPGLPACDFDMLLVLVNNIINYLLFVIATPLVAVILVYVGWLYLSSGGSTENVGKAKKIFSNVIIGYVIGLVAWLVIKAILVAVGFTGPLFLK